MLKAKRRTGPKPASLAIQFSRVAVYEAGYEWTSAREALIGPSILGPLKPLPRDMQGDWVLAPRKTKPARVSVKAIPLDLYLRFGDLEMNRESVGAFAQEFGMLGLKEEREGLVFLAENRSHGELLSAWCRQIKEIKDAIGFWNKIKEARAGDHAAIDHLKARFKWQSERSVRFVDIDGPGVSIDDGDIVYGGSLIANAALPGVQPWAALERDRVIGPAFLHLRELINRHGKVSASLNYVIAPDHSLPKSQRPEVHSEFTLNPDVQGIFFYPENLIAGLWIQLAEAVTAGRQYRRCDICQRIMMISASGDGFRAERRTCSSKCRTQLSLKRKKAEQLIARGNSPKKVARSLQITEIKLKELLATANGKRKKPSEAYTLAEKAH
jgi:hypothetical protein